QRKCNDSENSGNLKRAWLHMLTFLCKFPFYKMFLRESQHDLALLRRSSIRGQGVLVVEINRIRRHAHIFPDFSIRAQRGDAGSYPRLRIYLGVDHRKRGLELAIVESLVGFHDAHFGSMRE